MKRVGLFLLAVGMVAGMAGCGGGGDSDYDFNGTWAISCSLVQSNPLGAPSPLADVLLITQSGTAITVKTGTIETPLTGVCDPGAGTYSVVAVENGLTMTLTAQKVDDDSMTGEFLVAKGSVYARYSAAMQLTGRARVAWSSWSSTGRSDGAAAIAWLK